MFPRYPHVRDATVPVRIQHQILWLDIAVDDLVLVHVFQTDEDVGDEELGLFFTESALVAQVVPQVAPVEVVHDKVEVLPVLESCGHVD